MLPNLLNIVKLIANKYKKIFALSYLQQYRKIQTKCLETCGDTYLKRKEIEEINKNNNAKAFLIIKLICFQQFKISQ